MSKSRIAMAVVILATLLPSAALARGFGLGPLGVVRSAFAHLLPFGGVHHHHHFVARHGHAHNATLSQRDSTSQNDANAPPRAAEEPAGSLLGNPQARGQIVADAAMAGWRGGRTANGWWRHRDGGYGWVGPLFWPFAFADISDYTIFGDGLGFWDYGYPDIYAGIFAPYGQQDLAAYLGQSPPPRRHHRMLSLQQFCGDAQDEASGLPIDQVRQAIQPNDAQRAALDDLASTSTQAAQIIRASCPRETPSTAPARLAAMQERVEAMIKAELSLQPPLGKLYDLLNDEQKERLNALSEGRRKTAASNAGREAPGKRCNTGQSAALQWPADEIEERLHPNDTQRGALEVLQDASARAVDMLKDACEEEDAITPLARLATADRRLDAVLQAVKLVSTALEDFYATLSDAQKAQFEAIGPKRTA